MTYKNPYENQEDTLDIPDFVEDKTRTDSSSVDMSIFKMSDDELYDDDEQNEESEEESRPKRKKNSAMIMSLIVNLLLLLICAAMLVYAINQHKAYVKANTEYQQLQASQEAYKQQIADKDKTIETLSKQIEDLQNKNKATAGGKYRIVDGPVTFRTSPTKDPDNDTTYNGKSTAVDGEEFNVLEIVEDKDLGDQLYWAKVAENVYFCIGNQDDEVWAKKVD